MPTQTTLHRPNASDTPNVASGFDTRAASGRVTGSIVIVDDESTNISVIEKMLESAGYFHLKSTTESANAFNLIRSARPDLVLLDLDMPGASGIEVLRMMHSASETKHVPVLVLTAETERDIKLACLKLGATDFLIKPVDPMELVPRVRNALQTKSLQDRLRQAAEHEKQAEARTREFDVCRRQAIYCLARAAELRDNDTGNHVIRVGRYSGIIAKHLGMPQAFIEDIELAAQLHDVGKITVPDAILMKPGKLEQNEFEIIQDHVKHGRNLIQPSLPQESKTLSRRDDPNTAMFQHGSDLMRLAATIAQTHHEKYDGSGYPLGLSGSDIPIEGRIAAVADVYDALSSERSYKRALPRQRCFEILEAGRGEHFDPKVLDAFFAGASEIVKVQVEYMDYE